MHTLSLGRVGLTPAFGAALGACLTDLLDTSLGGCGARAALTKLYLEEEPGFGNEGCGALMRALQFNSSLKMLALRACRLSRPCVEAVARFLSLSTRLEVRVSERVRVRIRGDAAGDKPDCNRSTRHGKS